MRWPWANRGWLTLEVTAADIAAADPLYPSSENCPIAQAIRRQFAVPDEDRVFVDVMQVNGSTWHARPTRKMLRYMADWDFRRQAKPETFKVRVR